MATTANTADLEYASKCIIPTTWMKFPLVAVHDYNHDSKIFDFGLAEGQTLQLPTCACVLLKGPTNEAGEPAVRPYTPMSEEGMVGAFQLLVKKYEQGVVSSYLHNLKVGSEVEFKHISFNVKIQYPFNKKSLTMITGGTGITPIFQALHKLLKTPGDETEVSLLFGNRKEQDILLRAELDEMVANSNGRFKVTHILSEAEDSWEGEKGYINEGIIEKYGFGPDADTMVFVCGPPPMYNAICGPRDQKELAEGSLLQKMGYTAETVFKF